MRHPGWLGLHPNVTTQHLGFLPTFLDMDDERPAAKQFDERYGHGGWRPFGKDKFSLKRYTLRYPGDPPMRPIAMCMLRDEMILLYESDVVVILQKDGRFEVARMD